MLLDTVILNVRKKIGFNIIRKFVMSLKKETETDFIYNNKIEIYIYFFNDGSGDRGRASECRGVCGL
jgi:hypothetical protein